MLGLSTMTEGIQVRHFFIFPAEKEHKECWAALHQLSASFYEFKVKNAKGIQGEESISCPLRLQLMSRLVDVKKDSVCCIPQWMSNVQET